MATPATGRPQRRRGRSGGDGEMKSRTPGFLSADNIDHGGEVFDYIRELHEYLWRFVRAQLPGASGDLESFLDVTARMAEMERMPAP